MREAIPRATDRSSDDKWERNIIPVRVHINAWAAAAVVVALFHFKAVGANPPDFYLHLRWMTLPVAGFGLWLALEHDLFGWMFLLAAIAVLYNPLLPVHLDSATWSYLNIASGLCLISAAFLVRWNTASRWVTGPRDVIDKSAVGVFFTASSGIFLHIAIIVALLPVSYALSADEQLIDDWVTFRDEHLWLVGIATVTIMWLYYWLASSETVRRFLTTSGHRRDKLQP
jgi:hypothetical protein